MRKITKKYAVLKKPKQQRSIVTFNSIVTAGEIILANNGYGGTTTHKIAEKAGVSIGTLYQYFPNKEAITLAIIKKHANEMKVCIADLLEKFAEDKQVDKNVLSELVNKWIELHDVNPKLHKALFEQAPLDQKIYGEADKTLNKFVNMFSGYLQKTQGVRKDKNYHIMALMTAQLVELFSHWYVLHGKEKIPENKLLINEVVDILEKYIFDS